MDIALVVAFLITLFVFEPGNVEINAYCKAAVQSEEFESRKSCWEYYTDYREDIPKHGSEAGHATLD